MGTHSRTRVLGRLSEDTMKKIAIAAALTLAATTAFAGGMSEPVMAPEVVAEVVETATTGSSSSTLTIAALLVALLALGGS